MDNTFNLRKFLAEGKLLEEETVYKVEKIAKHPSGIEAKVYSNGIIEICKDGNRITAYKFTSPFDRTRGFEKIEKYFKDSANQNIDKYEIWHGSGIQYAGTVLSIDASKSDECGEKGLKTISWWR
jgi:hypothetical protein